MEVIKEKEDTMTEYNHKSKKMKYNAEEVSPRLPLLSTTKESNKEININKDIEIQSNILLEESNKTLNNFTRTVIQEINNRTVHAIKILRDMVFVGGSGGMLMRIKEKDVLVYETESEEAIQQIDITNYNHLSSLFVFFDNFVLIYKDLDNCNISKKINMPGIGHIYKSGNWIYIPLQCGIINKIYKKTFEIIQYNTPFVDGISSLVVLKKNSLVVKNDFTLHKAIQTKDSFINNEEIKEYKNIRKVLNMSGCILICSDYQLTIMNFDFVTRETINFGIKIKIVKSFNESFGIVNDKNKLNIYQIENKKPKQKITRKYNGDITALVMSEKKALLCIRNEIITVVF